jgi:cytochrome c
MWTLAFGHHEDRTPTHGYAATRRRHERFRQELAAGITTTDYAEPRLKRRKIMRTWLIVGIALAASKGAVLAQDAAAGEQVFKRLCSPCHEIGPEAKIKLGPPLNGIDDRKAGTFEGFNYSPANKSSGITWNEQAFDKYIRAPMQEMPGTRMAFVGIKNDKDVADIWAYLKQFGPDGAKK